MSARADVAPVESTTSARSPEAAVSTKPVRADRHGTVRAAIEFLLAVSIAIVVSRGYFVEAYIVPTGSMAPTLLGSHTDWICPDCGASFSVGSGDDSTPIVCPNCGYRGFEPRGRGEASGDRVLVQKHIFDFRRPRRWEPVVFWNPEAPDTPYVKRTVGLPGEKVSIRGGDVIIDDRIARKSLAEQRALRQLVYDHDHAPRGEARSPRWIFGTDGGPTRWRAEDKAFVFEGRSSPVIDWVEYQHWQPERRATGPVRDFAAYDGERQSGANRVDDLMLSAEVAIGGGAPLMLAISNRADHFVVQIATSPSDSVKVTRNGEPLSVKSRGVALHAWSGGAPRFQLLEVSTFDRRLLVALDGELVFEAIDWEPDESRPPSANARIAFGLAGGRAIVKHLRVYRDVYYTDGLANSMRTAHAVSKPVQLGADEYFVLGDNSPISNDSRFWRAGPVVHAGDLIGKPFLVHLPGASVPVSLLNRLRFWISDFRQIRYIH